MEGFGARVQPKRYAVSARYRTDISARRGDDWSPPRRHVLGGCRNPTWLQYPPCDGCSKRHSYAGPVAGIASSERQPRLSQQNNLRGRLAGGVVVFARSSRPSALGPARWSTPDVRGG